MFLNLHPFRPAKKRGGTDMVEGAGLKLWSALLKNMGGADSTDVASLKPKSCKVRVNGRGHKSL